MVLRERPGSRSVHGAEVLKAVDENAAKQKRIAAAKAAAAKAAAGTPQGPKWDHFLFQQRIPSSSQQRVAAAFTKAAAVASAAAKPAASNLQPAAINQQQAAELAAAAATEAMITKGPAVYIPPGAAAATGLSIMAGDPEGRCHKLVTAAAADAQQCSAAVFVPWGTPGLGIPWEP